MPRAFHGFPKELFNFFEDLSQNNNRAWFNDNKPYYKEFVQEPMLEFISVMGDYLQKISSHYVADSRPIGGSMFRIYKDVRFSKDKTPYKEHVACQFRHEAGKDAHAPGFYVCIDKDKCTFGGGIWKPDNSVLNKIRSSIVENDKVWNRVRKNKAIQQTFGGISGDGLIRPPKGFDKDHPYIEDLKRKSFFTMKTNKPDLVMKKTFITEVNHTFKTAKPLMKFLTDALELPF